MSSPVSKAKGYILKSQTVESRSYWIREDNFALVPPSWAITKSGTGTWDAGTRRRAGIRGRDKQIAPDFCAELVKYFFFEGQM